MARRARREKGNMIVGFTGTRNGMTVDQKRKITTLMRGFKINNGGEIHAVHGDCRGADEQFDDICRDVEIEAKVRPCTLHNMRAHCEREALAEPKPPLDRNKDIVADADVLIACASGFEEKRRSGTWATVRYMRKKGYPIYIVYPNGRVFIEGNDGKEIFAGKSAREKAL